MRVNALPVQTPWIRISNYEISLSHHAHVKNAGSFQFRIQDYSGTALASEGGYKLLFGIVLAGNRMKIKKSSN